MDHWIHLQDNMRVALGTWPQARLQAIDVASKCLHVGTQVSAERPRQEKAMAWGHSASSEHWRTLLNYVKFISISFLRDTYWCLLSLKGPMSRVLWNRAMQTTQDLPKNRLQNHQVPWASSEIVWSLITTKHSTTRPCNVGSQPLPLNVWPLICNFYHFRSLASSSTSRVVDMACFRSEDAVSDLISYIGSLGVPHVNVNLVVRSLGLRPSHK